MPNGKVGDHPYTDIVIHGHEVYSAAADTFVREIAVCAAVWWGRPRQSCASADFAVE